MGEVIYQKKDVLSPGDQLRSMVIGHLKFIDRTPAVPAILFSRELHAENELLRLFFAKMMAQRHKKLAEIISSAKENDEFSENLDAEDAAYLILALIQGLAMRWSLNARKFDLAREGERLLDLLLLSFSAD